MRSKMGSFLPAVILGVFVCGCSGVKGNIGQMPVFAIPVIEAKWIREGEPLQFEDERWYPQDAVDVLLDSEVYLLGEYRGVQFFIQKADVRPFHTLYTKFGPNKFRMFKLEEQHDQDRKSQ